MEFAIEIQIIVVEQGTCFYENDNEGFCQKVLRSEQWHQSCSAPMGNLEHSKVDSEVMRHMGTERRWYRSEAIGGDPTAHMVSWESILL